MSESHDSAAGPQRASRWEILGAWLNIWTAPHDVVVPPPPSRRTLALGALGLAAIVAVVALVGAPVLRDIRDRDAARAQRDSDELTAARMERQRAEQRPRFGTARRTDRASVVAAIETAIGADARERFDDRARAASCAPAPGTAVVRGRAVLDCLAPTSDIEDRGALGIPYRAVAQLTDGRYAFCKLNPPPGEQALIDPSSAVRVPAACSARD